MKLSRNYPRWRYGHDKPACRLLKTSQESCEWLISLRHGHRMLISSRLSPSQKVWDQSEQRRKERGYVCKQN